MKASQLLPTLLIMGSTSFAMADDFPALDEALPTLVDAYTIAPVFDFDGDGCFPSAGISRAGEMNGGLKTSGPLGGHCRSHDFLNTSNTLHRHACLENQGDEYCGHIYMLYFEKDQVIPYLGFGHRHDWEYAAVFTKNGVVTHGTYSSHGDAITKPASELPFEGTHLKIVYHKDGALTHAMRFAKQPTEIAENPYGRFVTPTITSWYKIVGDGLSNADMRYRLNNYDYGSAHISVKDSSFLGSLNKAKPSSYPQFTQASIDNAAE
ncbi:NPP1 family protein [Aestuariibacter sp. AA17]|uniref:NPP1 family protein n=1 Tax=Fluctibacter corallii TaxID=2984329 RepID=A0ABT3ABF8_9ALTE|nr:NPP1 family protein [Aestuariibacter sp. AA17]MCV2886000.1 NPP1 family protein [Aestuariibacter sp. AA17]